MELAGYNVYGSYIFETDFYKIWCLESPQF